MTPKESLKNLGYDDDVIVKILEWNNKSLPETLNYYIEKTFNYFFHCITFFNEILVFII